jgi:actin-like ATPase involved in cell morphogenesis
MVKVRKGHLENKKKISQIFEDAVNESDDEKELCRSALGVDIGTSKTVFAKNGNGNGGRDYFSQRNAFIEVDYSKFTEKILQQNDICHYRLKDSIVVYGDGAEIFANTLNKETRRPLKNGLLNANEVNAVEIIKGILDDLVPDPEEKNAPLCFSIPAAPKKAESDIIYHEAIIKRLLDDKGFKSKSINEGMAVVFSELEKENFTGFGISAGGGMCNVCLSFLSIPHISFSISKGGDYIDEAVSSVTREVSTRVRAIKENKLNLLNTPENEIEDALHIYYDDLIRELVMTMKKSIEETSRIPKLSSPLPIVLSGGTAKPKGFKERFEKFLSQVEFPVEISEIRMAKDPLNATANGALIAAMYQG